MVEDGFNRLRDDARHTKQGSQGRRRRFHVLASSSILVDCDRPRNISHSPGAPLGASKASTAAFEPPEPCDFSLGEEVLQTFMDERSGMSAAAHMNVHMVWSTLCAVSTDFSLLSKAWLSLLCRRGHILRNTRTAEVGLVLHATEYGVLLSKCKIRRIAQPVESHWVDAVGPTSEGGAWVWHRVVLDVSEWKSLPTRMIAPSEVSSLGLGAGSDGFVMFVRCERLGKTPSLLEAAARDSFRGMSVPYLLKMIEEFRIPYDGPKPKLEAAVLRIVVKWALPNLPEDELEAIISARSARQARQFESVLTEANAELVKNVVGGDDGQGEDMAREVAEQAKAIGPVRSHVPAVAAPQRRAATSAVAARSTAAGSAADPPGNRIGSAQAKPAIPMKEYTIIEARGLVPTAKGCSSTIHTNCAWQVKYALKLDYPRSHTASFMPSDQESSYRALLDCLQWVWRVHRGLNPTEECPHDLGVLV